MCAISALHPIPDAPAVAEGIGMDSLLRWVARAAGVLGLVLSVVAGVARMRGTYLIDGFEAITLLQVGTTGMVLGCLAYLASIAERRASAG
jgi:hypothetical protein